MEYDYALHYDDRGRPFFYNRDGSKNYVSPASFGGQVPEGGGGFRQRPGWNQNTGEWETPIDFGKILTLATGGLLSAGIGSALAGGGAAAASGGGAGAAGGASTAGVLPSATIGTGYIGPIVGGTGLAGTSLAGAGTVGGVLASSPIGSGYIGPIVGGTGLAAGDVADLAVPGLASRPIGNGYTPGIPGGSGINVDELIRTAGGGAGLPGTLPTWLKTLIPIASLIAGKALSPGQFQPTLAGGGGEGGNFQTPPELQQLLAEAVRRAAYQAPLFNAASNQALGGLPTYARQGG